MQRGTRIWVSCDSLDFIRRAHLASATLDSSLQTLVNPCMQPTESTNQLQGKGVKCPDYACRESSMDSLDDIFVDLDAEVHFSVRRHPYL